MTLTESVEQGATVAVLKGELDLSQSPAMQKWFAEKAAAKTPLVILDFAELAFIDSSGIAALIGYYKSCSEYGGRFAIVAVRDAIMSVFNLVSLGTFIPIYKTREEAFEKLGASAA